MRCLLPFKVILNALQEHEERGGVLPPVTQAHPPSLLLIYLPLCMNVFLLLLLFNKSQLTARRYLTAAAFRCQRHSGGSFAINN